MSPNPPADTTRPAAGPAAAPAACYTPAALGTSRGLARRQLTARYAHPRTPITERYQRRSREPEQSRYGRTPPGRLPSPRAPQSRAGFSAGTGVPPPGRPCAAPHRGDPRPTAPTGDGLRAPSRSNPGTGNPQPPHRSPAREATGGPARGAMRPGLKQTQE